MENGDLANKPAPKLLLVFEGIVGECTDTKRSDKKLRKGQAAAAIRYWELNPGAAARILYLFHRKDISFEVVTFLGMDFATEVRHFLDHHDIPVHRVWATTPEILGRSIGYMTDLVYVYDPDPERWLMYGSKGGHLTDVNQIGHTLGDRGIFSEQ